MLPCLGTLPVYFYQLSYLSTSPGCLTDLGGGERLQPDEGKATWVCWISAGTADAWQNQVFQRAREGQQG